MSHGTEGPADRGDASESLEVLYPYQRLLEEGNEVDIAAPSQKRLQVRRPRLRGGLRHVHREAGVHVAVEVAFADVDPSAYVALVVPGGRGPEYLPNDPDCRRIIQHFFEQDRPVAQLCHAPLALAAAGVLTGRRTAAYPPLQHDVAAAGAEFVDAAAVVDGQMVSARAWPDHPSSVPRVPRHSASAGARDARGGLRPRLTPGGALHPKV